MNPHHATTDLPRSDVLGVPFFGGDLHEAVEVLRSVIERGDCEQACVLATNNVVWAGDDPALLTLYRRAFVCLADGVPVVWASRLLGRPIAGRSTGYDLLPALCEMAAAGGHPCFFLGGAEGVAEVAARRLQTAHPGLRVAGTFSPPFRERFTAAETREMVDKVNRSGARILFVSLTSPKQDVWIAQALPMLRVNLAIGIGAALDVAAGRFERPPDWMRRHGLEWAHRLAQEPVRLARRYLLEAPRILPRLAGELLHEWRTWLTHRSA